MRNRGSGHGPRLQRLAPDLRCVVADNPGPLTLDGTRSWILGRVRPVVVDPGPASPDQLEALEAALEGRAAEAICLTHAHGDHAGCARDAPERLGAPLLASPRTLRRLGLPGRGLSDGDRVEVDGGNTALEALETPGHSRDHLCFLWHPRRDLLTGDLVLGEGSSLVVHPDGEVGAYLTSLGRLVALQPRRLLPGHGPPAGPPAEKAVAKLEEYRRHRLERDRQVREAVSAGARTLADVRDRVYGPLSGGLEGAADLATLAHLAHLRRQGIPLPEPLSRALEAEPGTPGGGTEDGEAP